jgi:hypothetical protein
MQGKLQGAAWAAGIVVAAALAPAARGQAVVIGPVVVAGPNVRVQGVTIPDGGTATLGGYSQLAESRTEFGVPILDKTPIVSRGFRNVGYGRTVVSRRVVASVRIIDLRDEEYRQTGYISR